MEMNEEAPDTPSTPAERKPYEKPAFRFEKVFVTTALSCGKIGDISTGCINHHSAS